MTQAHVAAHRVHTVAVATDVWDLLTLIPSHASPARRQLIPLGARAAVAAGDVDAVGVLLAGVLPAGTLVHVFADQQHAVVAEARGALAAEAPNLVDADTVGTDGRDLPALIDVNRLP